ncbi:MAG: PAS domain S-box protein, partial [Pseudomonadota bacterium]|nr:PAS domain S-box protein [Pseudomonadota bacterium]
QQALRDSAALLQSVLNSVADGIITLRASGGIIEKANPAAARMFGYVSGEVIGKSFGHLIPELDRDPGNGSIDYYSASDQERSIGQGREVTGRRKDGSNFSMEIVVSEMFLGGERFFTGILRDITTRKLSEEALFRAGALQRAIFNSANFSSIATDASGVIQIFNVGAERMLGYAADEVMNRITPAEISDPQEVIARAKALSVEFSTPILPGFEALAFKASRGIEDIYELTYVRKDGSRLPAAVSVTALRDPQNAIIGYLLIGTDNTARKHVEAERQKLDQRLRDQQFYTRSLVESNIDALMTTDQFGIITDVNRQMETLTGCTRDELIGAPFKNYFTDAERAEAGIKQVMNENKLTNYELTARARDGRETVVSYNATTFYDRNRALQGVFAAARDITERKLMDQALQNTNLALETAKSVAEKANLAKSEFLSSMSHELRTPLSAILGFAQLIESGTPQLTPTQKRGIDQILRAGWYLLDLINEILDLALIESGKLSLSLEPVSLTTVMHECEAITETLAEKRGVRISFPTFDKEVFIQADRIRLKQSLINLLSNAIKYNKANGTVGVSFVEKEPGRIRICVEDTGEGLSPEQLERLFQPFNRLGQESTAEEGTGIGLVVCKRLIELMGGVIGVESTVGRGSVFWIELKLTGEQHFGIGSDEISTLARRLVSDGVQVQTLLYVEDNPANLMLVEDLIARRSDIRLLSARDGRAGIDIALVAQPDVILMDINLPDISGITVLKILATDPATAHIPVVALSANAIPRDIEKGLEAGFFRYLTKPIMVNQLMDTLDEAFALASAMEAPAADEQAT